MTTGAGQHAGVDLDEASGPLAGRLRLATLVARGVPEDEIFAIAAEEAARLVGAHAGGVLRLLGEQRAVIVGAWRAAGVRGLPVNAEMDFDRANSAIGRMCSTRRPARADTYEGARGELPVVMQAVGLRASVAAPILIEGEVWGAIVASTTGEEPMPAEAEHRLDEFTELVALAVAGAAARRELAESRLRIVEAADEARRRLERRAHEGHQQHLLALSLKLRLARERAQAGSELAGLIDSAAELAADANASLRDLTKELYPAVLTERGLAAALQALAARAGVPVRLLELPKGRFPPVTEATAYFVVAEALANAARHARATEASVLVAQRGDRLVAEVADDGIGGAEARSGLVALADRTAALGGTLEIESPGGTVIRAAIPIDRS